jgi:16S rRNA (cytosine967-C5)-methyltransferase
MSRYHSYINTAEKIIVAYKGDVPFSVFIKSFFAKEKRYGSNDRREISTICYHYFRAGVALKKYLAADKMIAAVFLCNNTPSKLLEKVNPGWNELINIPVAKKMNLINNNFTLTDLFPFTAELSAGIAIEKFCASFLVQPQLFLRIRRPGNTLTIAGKIKTAAIEYVLHNDTCLQLPTGCNIETVLAVDKEVVVQDYSSQQVLNFLIDFGTSLPIRPSVWDCCAASGGKSILLYDLLKGKCKITVSDIRPAILSNLHLRFKKASIKNYQYFIADIANPTEPLPATMYDIIICDAPCTGSGTWSRTPEQLYFFDVATITTYTKLQKQIAENTIPHLAKGGIFVYITCSVFAKENELIATFIQEKFKLQLLQQSNLLGYGYKADSMFVAVFKN